MIHHKRKKRKKKEKRSFQIKNELPTKLVLALTIELLDWIIAVDADFDASPKSLLWMSIWCSGQIVAVDVEKIATVDADFDASAKSKNDCDSSDKENECVVEFFGVWLKIDADDLLAWVGVGQCVSDLWEKNKKERTKRTLNWKKAKRTLCVWVVGEYELFALKKNKKKNR